MLLAAGTAGFVKIRDKRTFWLLAALVFVLSGVGRGRQALADANQKELAVEEVEGGFVWTSGVVTAVEEGNRKMEITLKDVRVYEGTSGNLPDFDGGEAGGISCLLVSIPEDVEVGRAYAEGDAARKVDVAREADAGTISWDDLPIGSRIAIAGEIASFSRSRNPGNFDYREYYRSQGIDGRLYGESAVLLADTRYPFADFLASIRRIGKKRILAAAEERDAGIFCAAVLGDKKALDSQVKDLYQRNGIAHLLAISGLHLSIIGMGLYRLLRKVGLSYKMAGAISSVFIISYGILTGASPSAVRAAAMMTAAFLAAGIGRTYDLLSAASLALILLVWESPFLLLQGGLQLSFGAVFAIGGISPVLERILWGEARETAEREARETAGGTAAGTCPAWIRTLSVSVSIQLVTMPMILYHFFQIPLYGMLLNLAVIPLMGIVICSGLGMILLGGISVTLGILAAGPGHYVLRCYELLLSLVSHLPHANLIMGRPSLIAICAYYALLLAGFWLIGRYIAVFREKRKRYPLSAYPVLAALCMVCILVLTPRPVSGLEAAFLDVGQGDGILLRTGRNAVLVDGGSTSDKNLGKNRLEPCLKSYGISTINYAFITHGDRDHLSGIEYLLKFSPDIQIENLVLPYHGREDESLKNLKALAEKRGVKVTYEKAGDRHTVSGIQITCFYPGLDDIPSDTNEESTVLRVDYGDCHMLLTGDMSAGGEEQMLRREEQLPPLSQVQILKVAHHGSKYSTTSAFLEAVNPTWAILSYEKGNSYGHPHKEVTDRLKDHGITSYGTADWGAILLRTDGREVKWRSHIPH